MWGAAVARAYVQEERATQKAVRQYLAVNGFESVAVPNGAVLAGDKTRRAIQMMELKAEGLRPGFPDLIVFNNRGQVGFMEIKTEGGKLSQTQNQVRNWMLRDGHKYAVVRSVDDAKETIAEWGWL